MATLEIDAKVTGLESVEKLNKSVEGLEKSTRISNTALVGWTAVLGTASYAIGKVVGAGHEYLTNMEDMQNSIVTTTELENTLSTSFGMASASILEQTGLWGAYREVLIEVSNALDVVAGAEAIIRQAKAESISMEKEYQDMLKENAKWKEAEHRKELSRIKREDDANIRHQKLLTSFEEKAQADLEKSEKAYEDKLIALDANIDAIYKETDAQIANSQVKQEAVEVTDDLVQSLNEQADASNKAGGSGVGGGGSTSTSNYTQANLNQDWTEATNAQMQGYNMEATFAELNRRMAELVRISQDTNDATRGY